MTNEMLYEAFGDIDDKYIEEAKKRKKRGKVSVIKWGAMAACICLVAGGVYYEYRLSQVIGRGCSNPSADNINVNKIKGSGNADMDVTFTSFDNLDEAKEFEIVAGKISNDYTLESIYSVNAPISVGSSEYVPHDYVLRYKNQAGGEVKIKLCTFGEPLRDCYFECKNPKATMINNTEVFIYGIQDNFEVHFSHENIYYDIEARNITLDELVEILRDIIE